SFAAFYLQDGINECAQGARPPGLFYVMNLHPYARLSVSTNLLDDRGNRVGVLAPNLSPLRAVRAGCSNGFSKPGPITDATLEVSAGAATSLPPTAPPPPAATLPAAPPPVANPPLPQQPGESTLSEPPALPLA